MLALAIVALVFAAVPAGMFARNLFLYRAPAVVGAGERLPAVSILVPARNEERGIAVAVKCLLASGGVEIEVVVMDDASTDATAEIVREIGERDARVRLVSAAALPEGWNGKQHACWMLAGAARHDVFCYVDADVRVSADAVARMARFLRDTNAGLLSGFPRQEMVTWMEWMLLPLIHFVLLGFLSLKRMRAGTDARFAAGCGQFMMVRRDVYFASGGHAAICASMHDGLMLPRAVRVAGFKTDLADMTELARCRMYGSARDVWQGLGKNATEGMAASRLIVPVTAMLLLGQVLPVVLGVWALAARRGGAVGVCIAIAVAAVFVPRVIAAVRFKQRMVSAVMHPVGVVMLVALQWWAWSRKMRGGRAMWKDRGCEVG